MALPDLAALFRARFYSSGWGLSVWISVRLYRARLCLWGLVRPVWGLGLALRISALPLGSWLWFFIRDQAPPFRLALASWDLVGVLGARLGTPELVSTLWV